MSRSPTREPDPDEQATGDTPDLLPITLDDMIAELRRELRLRIKVYPRMIQDGRMKREAGKRQVAMLEAIIAHLEAETSRE